MKLKPHTIRGFYGDTVSVVTRVERLGEERGGGRAISKSFHAVLEEILDHGPRDTKALMGAALQRKRPWDTDDGGTARIYRWQEGDPAELFTIDVMEQLESHGLVRREDDLWHLGENFRSGEELICITLSEKLDAARGEYDRSLKRGPCSTIVRTKEACAAAAAADLADMRRNQAEYEELRRRGSV